MWKNKTMMMVTSPPPAPDMSVADGLFLCRDPTFKRFSILAKGFYMQEGSIGFCLLRDFHILAHICTCYCSVLTPERDDAAGQPEYIQDDSLSDEKYFDKYSWIMMIVWVIKNVWIFDILSISMIDWSPNSIDLYFWYLLTDKYKRHSRAIC